MADAVPDGAIERVARALRDADALLIGAGAGMGVDSGLPDFRGNTGFWKAYPLYRGRSLPEISNPYWFHADPAAAWGFFGHRLSMYRACTPHAGFALLKAWGERLHHGAFVFTSNVDGLFQKAGFDVRRVFECHGSLHALQCARPCSPSIWPADGLEVEVDERTMRAVSPLPRCPRCGAVARPNVLMFGDGDWQIGVYREQAMRYQAWRMRVAGARVVAIEIGAGPTIPTVRIECEQAGALLVRVNPNEADTPRQGVSLRGRALPMLQAIAERLER